MKSYTDLKQSKVLAKILPLESADMYYHKNTKGDFVEYPHFNAEYKSMVDREINYNDEVIPCWSLAALRNLLPPAIKPNKDSYLFESHNTFDNSWVYRYYNEDGVSYLYYKNINEVDACYEMILKLKELNLV